MSMHLVYFFIEDLFKLEIARTQKGHKNKCIKKCTKNFYCVQHIIM